MSDDAYRDEMDLDAATPRAGRPHGSVVSVRLEPDEAKRVRRIAEAEGLTLSQVMRRALAAYVPADPSPAGSAVYGGGHAHGRIQITAPTRQSLTLDTHQLLDAEDPIPTYTEPARLQERIFATSSSA